MGSPVVTGLLDSKLNYYVLKEKWWDWGSGDIYGQNGTSVGKMHRRVISMRALTEVSELDGTSFSPSTRNLSL